MKNTKNFLSIAILTNLFSIINFIYLSYIHYSTKFGLSEGKSLCNINQQFNCDVVAVSKYASLFDVPISNLGLMTNVISLALLSICALGITNAREKILRYSLWLSFLAVIASIVMGLISTLALGTLCLFCIVAYALSFLHFIAVLKAQSSEGFFQNLQNDLADLFKSFRYITGFFVAIPALAWLSNSIVLTTFGLDQLNMIVQESVDTWKANSPKELNINTGIQYVKDTEPKMTIIEFADFLCPHCRIAFKPLHHFVETRPSVRVVFKPFPLDGNCNPAIPNKGDNVRCELAYAALCANSLFNKGNEASEYIFEHQMSWNSATLENDFQKFFKELNFDSSKMLECMHSSTTREQLTSMTKEGASIMGTPTFFVNGKELPRGQLMPVLDAVLKTFP